jgi:hypothetical protein
MTVKFLQRSIWQRIFGISATDKPQDGWHYESGQLTISLDNTDRRPSGSMQGSCCFRGKQAIPGVPQPVQPPHRRLDYVPNSAAALTNPPTR